MQITKIVQDGYDISLVKNDDEFNTQCYCSVCGKYLGGKSFAYRVLNCGEFNTKMKFCKYCGTALEIPMAADSQETEDVR